MDNTASGETKKSSFWVIGLVLFLLPALYLLSSGPMAIVLHEHCGDWGSSVWETVYNQPLGKTPKPIRKMINNYLIFCDRVYWGRWN